VLEVGKYNNFNSKLDNITIREINSKLDYNLTSLNDRKQKLDDILSNTNFYTDYFDNYYKSNLTSNDNLSENNNVCRSLENMATYLLNSEEEKKQRQKNKEYKLYVDNKYFNLKLNKETFLNSCENIELENNIIHYLKNKENNIKKVYKTKITQEDLQKEGWFGDILRNYNECLNNLTNKLTDKQNINLYNRYYLTRAKGQIIEDMIYCKESFLKPIKLNLKIENESTKYNFDNFDFTNETHLKGFKYKNDKGKLINIKGLIYFDYKDYDINDDMYHVLLDLEKIINKSNLTFFEKQVLKLLRKGFNNSEIAKKLKTNHVKIIRTINKIIKKIKLVGETYDDK